MKSRHFIRWWSAALVLLLISTALLTACSAAPEAAPEEQEQIVAESEEDPAAEEPAEVVEESQPTAVPVVEEEEVEEAEAAPAEAAVPTGGTLHLASLQEPDTLDPHKTAMSTAAEVMLFFGGSLLHIDHNNELVPYHAISWSSSEDGLVWEFKLREDILFQDGTPLTASDYVWTFDRALDPEIASPISAGNLANVEKYEAVDDYTLRFTLLQPKFTFLYDLASEYLQPLPQAKVEELGDQFGRTPVGTGPFIVTEWQTGDEIVLERNPDFNWAPQGYHEGPVYIDEIVINIIPDTDTIMAALEAGQIDLADIEFRDLERFTESGFQIVTGSYMGFGPGILMNVTVSPLDDVRIRQALNYAINREAIVALILEDHGVAQYGPLSPSQIGYWPGVEEIGQHYDIEKAETLIMEAGYQKNSDGIFEKDGELLEFEVITPSAFDEWIKVAQVLQSEFEKLGILIDIQTLETGSLVQRAFSGDYELCFMGVGSREADILYDLFSSSNIDGGLNLSRVSNSELDTLLTESRTETDAESRQEILNEIQRIIVEEAYVIPIYAADFFSAVNPRVHDLYITNRYPFYFDVYLEE